MTTTKVEGRIDAPANKVWALVTWEAFADLMADVAGPFEYRGEGVGATRIISLPDGAKISERLIELEDGSHYAYALVDYGPLPWRDYVARVSVTPDGNGACALAFQAEFTPTAAPEEVCVKMWEDMFQAPLAAVRQKLSA